MQQVAGSGEKRAMAGAADGFRLQGLARAVLAEHGARDWTVTEDEAWCRVMPPERDERIQGWKLHLSATRLSAPEVVHRAATVLVAAGCGFKFAKSIAVVEEMTSDRYDRAQCGKIVTCYPADDEQLRRLAAALDEATAGLPGPAILSDRRLRPGSLVHYRYGVYGGVPVLTNDGSHQLRVQAPDGTTLEDLRKPWFCPPAWAVSPFPAEPSAAPAAAPSAPRTPGPVLLADRFEIREAIRHSARGGIYRAIDHRTGADVVVKQARAHVGTRVTGEDARDALRHESAVLAELDGIAAGHVELFDVDGHTFLVQESLPGSTLTQWVQDELDRTDRTAGLDPARVVETARRLAALLALVQDRGMVYRDFTPNNIIVGPDGGLRLIDPELAVRPGQWATRGFTDGFAAPEVLRGPRFGPMPGLESDLYSLGGVLFYLAVGTAPAFPKSRPEPSSPRPRLTGLLTMSGVRNRAARLLAPAVLGLTHEEPGARWTLARLGEFLDGLDADAPVALVVDAPVALVAEAGSDNDRLRTAGSPGGAAADGHLPADRRLPADRLGPDLQQRLVDDGLAHLLATLPEPGDDGPRLWSSTGFGSSSDACNVQHGAAGVLGLLTLADTHAGPGGGSDALRAALSQVAGWLDRRRTNVSKPLPGLYFGRAGTAWALHDAARRLDDPELAGHAAELALALPVRWPNPDVCHGAAGSALTQLHLWHATGREEFRRRAAEAADGLLAAAEYDGDRVYWPVPKDFDSALAGIRHLGFAHGVAGVGYALLAAARATGERKYLDAAVDAGNTLVAEAERGPWGARWRTDRDDAPGSGMLYHWCSGASGVGTFLVRLWQDTRDPAHLGAAEEAAVAVRGARWTSPTVACHGLAGNGEFLLDLADAVGGPYRDWAQELAATLYARHAVRDGRLLIADESGLEVTADWNVGLSGVVGFLLRLRHGGPRPWMADGPVLPQGGPAGCTRVRP
ncbi:class IV lanthionine synthetase LanL [Streptomyces sp. WM6372]|uniref:class IV lanthionine synthetase LanL n=1 Tax=Streptomyces sp. WM6372 TaxID=1415555 RepID=UPI000B284241|nr:class IV lanthionine synthetase LanL [Streptomyces sp. WM6372]